MSSARRIWSFLIPFALALLLLCLCLVWLFPTPTAVLAADPIYETDIAFGNKEQTCSLATGDFNQDGYLDVVAGNSNIDDIDCLYFDFDTDVDYDLVTSTLYLNDQTGVVSATLSLATMGDVVAGDLDGNGTLDLLAGNRVWLNDGTALFTDAGTFRATTRGRLALGDLNQDGALDIVATAVGDPTQIFYNDGSGVFTLHQTMPPATRIALGDLDGDGRLDILRGSTIHYNNSFGDFNFDTLFLPDFGFSRYALLADVNQDNALDIIGGAHLGRVEVYFNDGEGFFPQRDDLFGDAKSVMDLTAGDLNGDGALDIITANDDDQKNHLFLNNGFGAFPDFGVPFGGENSSTAVELADLDRNGLLDVIVGNSERPNFIYDTPLGGGFQRGLRFGGARDTLGVALGDINDDGRLDVVLVAEGDANRILFNNGQEDFFVNSAATQFVSEVEFGAPDGPSYAVAIADLDDNRDLEIIVGDLDGNYIYDYQSDTTTFFGQDGDGFPAEYIVTADLNGDQALDLVLVTGAGLNIYFNDGSGGFGTLPDIVRGDSLAPTTAVGDLNGDGHVDVVVGYAETQDVIYLNNGDGTLDEGTPFGNADTNTYGLSLGDVDGDGDLDLLAVDDNQQNFIYDNDGTGTFTSVAAFGDADISNRAQLTDVDNDGDLDAIVANFGRNNFLHLNDGAGNFGTGMRLGEKQLTWDTAVGDIDGDGFNDLVFANVEGPDVIHYNAFRQQGGLTNNAPTIRVQRPVQTSAAPGFSSPQLLTSRYITVPFIASDLEGDFIGHVTGTYSLDGGDNWRTAVAAPSSSPLQKVPTFVDTEAEPGLVLPPNTAVSVTLTFSELTRLVDLEVGLEIEHFGNNALSARLVSNWPQAEGGTDVELFDDLLGVSNGFSKLTFRDDALRTIDDEKQIPISVPYVSTDVPLTIDDAQANVITSTLNVATGPAAIDDLAVVGISGTHSYVGDLTMWLVSPSGTRILLIEEECGDTDNFNLGFSDEAFDEDVTCPLTGGNIFLPAEPLELLEGESPIGEWSLVIRDAYAEDGGDLQAWGLLISGPTDTIDPSLLPLTGVFRPNEPLAFFADAPSQADFTLVIENEGLNTAVLEWVGLRSIGREHLFVWDTFASGLFGQSENVVFRIEAFDPPRVNFSEGNFKYVGSTAPLNQWPYASDTSTPFSVRGTQVRVLSGTQPVADAVVYRLPTGQTAGASPLASATSGQPFITAADGYLQGRGVLNVNDQIVALLPIDTSDILTFTESFSLYHTSAPLNAGTNAPDFDTVTEFGVQELTVSSDNPLTLFDINISLEWDARNDETYLNQLQSDVSRASEILYDITNGQVALGDVNIYHAKENWTNANIVIYAANDLRPSASAGGIANYALDDVISPTAVITEAYLPGQVRMGPTWGRFGDADANLGEDWARAFAHEMSHYLFFLPDNYLGVDNGRLIYTDCYGSYMTDVYDDAYSEFLSAGGWTGDCLQSVAEVTTGRNDWETISQFWPWLTPTTELSGPATLPLAVTNIAYNDPEEAADTLAVPFFSLRDSQSSPIIIADGDGQGYLFKNADSDTLTDDYVVALGTPLGDQMNARGAEPGDRLCVYDFSDATTTKLGCDAVGTQEGSLTLYDLPNWKPQILVSAQSSVTLALTVTQASSVTLMAQVLPATGYTQTFPITSTVTTLTTSDDTVHTAVVTLPYPSANGHVRVWAEGMTPVQESMTQFLLSDGFDVNRSGFNVNRSGFNVNRSGFNVNRSGFNAPIASSDGQVRIYNVTDIFADTGTLSLQALSDTPNVPNWLSLVGKGYRFQSSRNFSRTISFEYLQSAVPSGRTYEHTLTIYYSPDEGTTWTALATELNTTRNLATAVVPSAGEGEGLYMLAATLEMPALQVGWNQLAYPVPFTRTLPLAVDSLGDKYTSIYLEQDGEWLLYDRTVPSAFAPAVNTLTYMEFGRAYWVYATEAITPYIGLPTSGDARAMQATGDIPATFYGTLDASEVEGAVAVGDPIQATIDGHVCGTGTIQAQDDNSLFYVVQVAGDDGTNGCGIAGRTVHFASHGRVLGTALWRNEQAQRQDLPLNGGVSGTTIYLPLVVR